MRPPSTTTVAPARGGEPVPSIRWAFLKTVTPVVPLPPVMVDVLRRVRGKVAAAGLRFRRLDCIPPRRRSNRLVGCRHGKYLQSAAPSAAMQRTNGPTDFHSSPER